ncbi:MAG: AsmA family protein [Rhodospirillales bacterium]|nr:AsmA family protein [Rhodospirillales bacterium]
MFRLIGRLFKFTLKMTVLAAGVGAIIAYANLSDVEGWKQDVQERVGKISGRRLSFDGPIDFKISYPPRIIAEGVRLENAKWGSKPDMLKARVMIAEIDFLPLLFGDVAVPRVQLVGVDILVETKGGGVSNWDDLNNFETSAGGAAPPSGFPVFPPVVGSGGVGVSGGTVTVANLVSGSVNTFTLPGVAIDVGGIAGLPCF